MEHADVRSIIEFGVGDGNQLSLYAINDIEYIGFDVSQTIVNKVRHMFNNDRSKHILSITEYAGQKAELTMSVDVIFHLVEDDVFHQYMEKLFASSSKFVIIYASNKEDAYSYGEHVRHRNFSAWIENNRKDFKLQKYEKNIYPEDRNDPDNTSFSDFYVYEKKSL